jgi:outer membrane protein TolC
MAATSLCRVGIALALAGCASFSAFAQGASEPYQTLRTAFETSLSEELPGSAVASVDGVAAGPYHLSLQEARSRVLSSSVIMDLASWQVAAKCQALAAARKDYWPKLLNSFSYFHFDDDLGTVVTTPGIFNPATSIAVPVIEQDAQIYTAAAIQPITPLLKVREAVNISAADVGAAEAQRQFARIELCKGVEQLYFGILAAQRIRAGLEQAVAGARQLSEATKTPGSQISLVEAQQGLLTTENQIVTLSEQLNQLVDLPPCTVLVLVDPPALSMPFTCVDDAVATAVSVSPKVREARMTIEKAEAAVRLAQADYVPSVNAYGFYVNQDATPTIQNDFTGVGMSATYLLEWGKKNDVLRQYKATLALARSNLRKEIQDSQLKAAKAFHEANRTQQALTYAQQLAALNRQVPMPTDPFQLKFVLEGKLESELGAIKAELDHRTAIVELRSVTGQGECP